MMRVVLKPTIVHFLALFVLTVLMLSGWAYRDRLPSIALLSQNYTVDSTGVAAISPQTLLTQIEAKTAPLILDVRTVREYRSGHVPGALNVPIRELRPQLDVLRQHHVAATSEAIVVYCERGVRVSRAIPILREAGFDSIVLLEGDMIAWRKYQMPMQTESRSTVSEWSLLSERSPVLRESQWIVSPSEAMALIEQGATVLDAQGNKLGVKRLRGAVPVSWKQFTQKTAHHRGKLIEDEHQLTQQLQDLGISQNRPVVVFANPPHGWGEDGRIVWMLRTLGHSRAVMVDGGINALLAAGAANRQSVQTRGGKGDFVVERSPTWDIQQPDLKHVVDHIFNTPFQADQPSSTTIARQPVIIDTREPREYAGETPYGEQRGGHIPGAIHLYFKDLLDEAGYLRPQDELMAVLQDHGITPETLVIAYCTGGIRSAWFTAVLISHGIPVKNYAGSMWEWSAAPAQEYPLEY